LGEIGAESTSTIIRFGESEFAVGVTHRRFRNGGDWAYFCCPVCDRRARGLWLLDGRPACNRCCLDRGVRYRIESMSVRRRAEIKALNLAARLEGKAPARLTPRRGRMLDRRSRLEAGWRGPGLLWLRGGFRKLRVALLKVPDSCADLDLARVSRVLTKHRAYFPAALGVSPMDLRRLTWARPHLLDEAHEVAPN
jgi:hypothetical protein